MVRLTAVLALGVTLGAPHFYDGHVPGHLASPDPAVAPGPRRWARRITGFVLAPSPADMRRIALAGLITSILIIVTGAAVRLSQSGLGCLDWPNCSPHHLA